MFEFISKILVTLTPAQRLWALTIVLVSIVIITLGPGWINRNDCSDLYPIVKNQKQEIASLNREILDVQKECTSGRIERENEIRELVDQLEIEIKACARAYCVQEASIEEIDALNILQATLLAMRRAVLGSVGGTHLRAPIHFSANPHYVLMM